MLTLFISNRGHLTKVVYGKYTCVFSAFTNTQNIRSYSRKDTDMEVELKVPYFAILVIKP